MAISFDRYHTYREISDFLQSCASTHPDLCVLESIGKSSEGRDIWMLEVTNRKTGPAAHKSAVYADGNIHAGEVTGCETVLWTISHLLENYGKDVSITSLLDTKAFYFVPRIAVDGAEYYLTTPYMLRSSLRQWPDTCDEKPGLYPEDVDGDGKILTMRVQDPDGGWKVSDKDPRLMIKRRPHELPRTGYYHVYTEGLVKEFDPHLTVKQAPEKHGLDFNRNFPANWAVYTRQRGSGDYPFSEPEMKAVAEFFVSHPNIAVAMAYHTYGGYVLRPFCTKRDDAMDPGDLQIYLAAGEVAQDITGYPCKSIFEWFTSDRKKPSVGSALEWFYETLGIVSFATELWDMRGRAGLKKRPSHEYRTLSNKEREEEELALLRWNDQVMNGSLFINWKKFKHPQLGDVEIGGWEPKFGRQNPPPSLLGEECKKNGLFCISMAAMAPELVIEKVVPVPLGNDLYRVDAVVKNQGYLPSHGTFVALKMNKAETVTAEICLAPETQKSPDGQEIHNSGPVFSELVAGKPEEDLGHLGGRAGGGDHKKKVSWIVKAKAGHPVVITARSGRAGSATKEIRL
ncbi:MAG TPA: carboxypeptidase [Firmicutes bacterium]|jgi:murein tripeptide amidase MpaA|nr:carboxypeptidase [Bacillota bacterium]